MKSVVERLNEVVGRHGCLGGENMVDWVDARLTELAQLKANETPKLGPVSALYFKGLAEKAAAGTGRAIVGKWLSVARALCVEQVGAKWIVYDSRSAEPEVNWPGEFIGEFDREWEARARRDEVLLTEALASEHQRGLAEGERIGIEKAAKVADDHPLSPSPVKTVERIVSAIRTLNTKDEPEVDPNAWAFKHGLEST